MSLGEFHEDHADDIVENDNKKSVAITVIVFGFITMFVSIGTGYFIFLLGAFAALIYGANSYSECRAKSKYLAKLEAEQQEETFDEALDKGEGR